MANMNTIARLTKVIAAVAPIHGVSMGAAGSSASCRIDFSGATAPQQTAAQAALAAFDWSQPTQDTWDAQYKTTLQGQANVVRLNADVTNSTTTLADCAGLSYQLAVGSYAFRFEGSFTAAAVTTGLQIAVNGPAMSFLSVNQIVWESVILTRSLVASAYNTPVLGTASAGATALPFQLFGSLTVTASGLFVLRFRSEIAASLVTIKRGSYGWLFGTN